VHTSRSLFCIDRSVRAMQAFTCAHLRSARCEDWRFDSRGVSRLLPYGTLSRRRHLPAAPRRATGSPTYHVATTATPRPYMDISPTPLPPAYLLVPRACITPRACEITLRRYTHASTCAHSRTRHELSRYRGMRARGNDGELLQYCDALLRKHYRLTLNFCRSAFPPFVYTTNTCRIAGV